MLGSSSLHSCFQSLSVYFLSLNLVVLPTSRLSHVSPIFFPMAVVMILLPEQTRHGVTGFVPMIIVVVFSAEQAGHGIPNLMSFGIVKVRAAEESGMAFSDLLTMLVPVDRVACLFDWHCFFRTCHKGRDDDGDDGSDARP